MRKPLQGANVDRGRGIVVHYAIASGGTGARDLHHAPEPVRAARSSASVTVPVTVAAAAKHDPLYPAGPGSVRALFTVDTSSQVDSKPIVTSEFSEGERVVVNGRYTLRLEPRVTANEPPASTVAKQSRSS
jgi:hypothetical protein